MAETNRVDTFKRNFKAASKSVNSEIIKLVKANAKFGFEDGFSTPMDKFNISNVEILQLHSHLSKQEKHLELKL